MAKFYSVRTREGTQSFRRGGQAFTRDARVITSDDVNEEQLNAIREESKLEISEIDETTARKQGWAPDPRTVLQRQYGDYPPPGTSSKDLAEQQPEGPRVRERQTVVAEGQDRESATGTTTSARELAGTEPGGEATDGEEATRRRRR